MRAWRRAMPLLFGKAGSRAREVLRRLKTRAAMKAQGPSARAPSLRSVALARDDKAVRCIPGLKSGASTVEKRRAGAAASCARPARAETRAHTICRSGDG